jgi:hypothetical protein
MAARTPPRKARPSGRRAPRRLDRAPAGGDCVPRGGAPSLRCREAPFGHRECRSSRRPQEAGPPPFPAAPGGGGRGLQRHPLPGGGVRALGEYEVLEEERVAVRLGHDVFLTGRLTPEAVDAAVQAIARFRGRMEALGVTHYRAVATSATRESRNGADLVARVRKEAGIELEVITGRKRRGWSTSPSPTASRSGTTKLDHGGRGRRERGGVAGRRHRHPLEREPRDGLGAPAGGALQHRRRPGRFQRLLREYAATLQIPVIAQHWKPRGTIATGGNAEALARLAGFEASRGTGRRGAAADAARAWSSCCRRCRTASGWSSSACARTART